MRLMRVGHPFLWASLALIAVIATATGWDIWASHRAHRRLVDQQMATLSGAAASQIESSLRAVDQMLENVAEVIDLERWPDAATEEWLRGRLASFPELRNLLVVDASGRMVGPNLSHHSSPVQAADLSDREYFQYLRQHWQDRQLYVSSPVISRLHNQPSVPLARAIKGRDGGFGGVVVVGLDPLYFERVLKSLADGNGMASTMLRRDGIILARHPDGDQFRGRSVADGSILREHVPRAPEGVVEVVSPLHGEKRLIGYRALTNHPLVVLTVMPAELAFGEWRERAAHGIVTVLALSAAVLLLAILLERRERQRRAAAAEAERANQAKSHLLATVSHELRTPLNAIIGFSDLMLSNPKGETFPPGWKGYLNDIHESGQHLLELINEILDFAAIEAGKLTLREERVDLETLLEGCTRMVAQRAEANGVALLCQVPPLPPVFVDRRRMTEIVLNLLSNSVKFTPKAGHIRLSAHRQASGEVVVVVADSGIGMDAEGVDKALQPFGQVENCLQRKFDGTGLGLPLVNGLVQLHGGKLVIDSSPNDGTTVSVHIPAARVLADEGAVLAGESAN